MYSRISPASAQKVAVEPLYTAAAGRSASGLCYTVRRLPRRRTAEERKYGLKSDYTGTDMFLSLGERSDPEEVDRVAELSVQALCTNRHLTEHLPVGEGGADFQLLDDVQLEVRCIAGPTRPLEPILTSMAGKIEGASIGDVAWRIVNMLSLNHLGLVQRAGGESGKSLREMLALFADMSDSATERKIRGIRSIDARPIVRRIRRNHSVGAARGTEITILIDDKAYEGSGPFSSAPCSIGFFREYVELESFHADGDPDNRTRRDHALAAAPRAAERPMTYSDELIAEPWRFDLFSVLRRFEREHPQQTARRRHRDARPTNS